MDKGTIFSGQPIEKRGFRETLRNGLDHDKPFLRYLWTPGAIRKKR